MAIGVGKNISSKLRRIPSEALARHKILFLAKHACSNGEPDKDDGTHAVYHHELLTTMRDIGLNVDVANSYEALSYIPEADFVVPLLNRGGFENSEMLAPLLLERHGLPYLGARPIIRGLADDKHLMKMVALRLGVPTMQWQCYRRNLPVPGVAPFDAARFVVKPNASSASWGVKICDDWQSAKNHLEALHVSKHDVIVEAWAGELDVAVPVIGGHGPVILPAMAYIPDKNSLLRSYEEKRGLIVVEDDPLTPVDDPAVSRELEAQTRNLMRELWPFDYGRFEFRVDPATRSVQFMEVNLSCNLWSKKSISRSAASVGISHARLVESILAHSMERHGLLRSAPPISIVPMPTVPRASALVLAGQREGRTDPLAAAHGVSHKAMVQVAGQAMIEIVLMTLITSPEISEVLVSTDNSDILKNLPRIQPHVVSGRLRIVGAHAALADSIEAAARQAKMPLLVTTADNVLLSHDSITEFIAGSRTADVAVGLTSRDAVLAAHPEGQRRFYEFGIEAWSGCNLYWIGSLDALHAIEIFRSGGQFVKHPGRILKALGLTNLICFLFAIGSIERIFNRISRRLGLNVKAVTISDGSAAIDVDNARSHAIAETLIRQRKTVWLDAA
jgi:D-alanine-D-alanine ligase